MHTSIRRFGLLVAAPLVMAAGAPRASAQGPLVAWGDNSSGLVTGVPTGTFVAVAAAGYLVGGPPHAVAIRSDGTLVSWGDGGVTPAGTFSAVAAGGDHNVAIRTDGTIVAWGADYWGQVSGPNQDGGSFIAAAAGNGHTVAIRSDGTLVSWGYDSYGEVSGTPAGTFVAVAAADLHSFAIRSDGTLVNWGAGYYVTYQYPAYVPAGAFSAVGTSAQLSIGLRTDGTLSTWWETGGETTLAGSFVAVATSTYTGDDSSTFAIRADGTLAAWGDDPFGVVSGAPSGTYSAVAAAGGFCVAIATPAAPTCVVSPLYDQSMSHRRGSTAPLRLQVLDANGANLSSSDLRVHAVSVTIVSGAAPGPLDDSGAANPDDDFRFDQGLGVGGGYIFNLSLSGYSTGTYNLNFTIGNDPSLYSVEFQVR